MASCGASASPSCDAVCACAAFARSAPGAGWALARGSCCCPGPPPPLSSRPASPLTGSIGATEGRKSRGCVAGCVIFYRRFSQTSDGVERYSLSLSVPQEHTSAFSRGLALKLVWRKHMFTTAGSLLLALPRDPRGNDAVQPHFLPLGPPACGGSRVPAWDLPVCGPASFSVLVRPPTTNSSTHPYPPSAPCAAGKVSPTHAHTQSQSAPQNTAPLVPPAKFPGLMEPPSVRAVRPAVGESPYEAVAVAVVELAFTL